MFNVPGSDIVGDWMSFLILVPIIIVVVLIVSWFAKTRAGEHSGSIFHRFLLVVTYPFYKVRSMLSDRWKGYFDNSLIVLYCAGGILLIMYAAN